MPGRRTPRRVREAMQSSHTNSVFPGGLDGASLIPSPVTPRWLDDNQAKCSEVFFFNDQFTMAIGQQALILTFVPITNSEHVYLVRSGKGAYQTEVTTWTREVGSKAIKVLPIMDVRAGETIVVEYAYYAQGPVPPCGSTFPLIVVPSPTVPSYTVYADGFPYITSSGLYGDRGGDAWVAAGYSSGDDDVVEVGPGLAPESSRSRCFRVLPGSYDTGEDVWMESDLNLRSGLTVPRWSTATYINYSTYYSITNAMPPSDWEEMGFTMYQYYPSLGTIEDNGSVPLEILLRWNLEEGWVLEMDCHGDYQAQLFPLGSWASVTPWDPGTHFMEVKLDIASETITARFDGLVFSQKAPGIWYPDELFSFEEMNTHYYNTGHDDISVDFWLYHRVANGSVPTDFCVDKTTLSTDVAYCQWGYQAPPGPVIPANTWTTPDQVWWKMDTYFPPNVGTAAPSGNAVPYLNYAYPIPTSPIAPGSTGALRANGSGSNWCFLKGNDIVAPPLAPKTLAAEFWSKGPGELWLSAFPLVLGVGSPGKSLFSLYVQYGGAPYDNAIAYMDAEASPQMRVQLPLPPGIVHHIKGRIQATPTWPPYPHPFEEKATYMLTLSLDVNGTAVSQTGPVYGTWKASEANAVGCSFLFRNSTIVVDEFKFGWE